MSKRKGTKRKAGKRGETGGPDELYTLSVYIVGGPLPKRFEGKKISRTIQILGSQTLEDLHEAIFRAYKRWESHLYDFLFWKGPQKRAGGYDLHRPDLRIGTGGGSSRDPARTTLRSLWLKEKQTFAYRFDYGDDWIHRIDVDAVDDHFGGGTYPKTIARSGGNPPQYPDDEEE
jgi:hypothetical protein